MCLEGHIGSDLDDYKVLRCAAKNCRRRFVARVNEARTHVIDWKMAEGLETYDVCPIGQATCAVQGQHECKGGELEEVQYGEEERVRVGGDDPVG